MTGTLPNSDATFLSRELSSETDLVLLHELNPEKYPFLLESTASGTPQGQFDILFACPGETLRLDAGNNLSRAGTALKNPQFLDALDDWWRLEATASSDSALPFCGGWFVFLGYELAQQIEPVLDLSEDPGMPIALATRIPAAVLRDRQSKRSWIITEVEHADLFNGIADDIDKLKNPTQATGNPLKSELRPDPGELFVEYALRAKEYIAAGDVFQTNLSREWHGELRTDVSAARLYRRLRETNPAPFSGLAEWGDFAVISSSPERLLSVRDGCIETRPIAGTRPRDDSPQMNTRLIGELLASPKERAEHVMLIDLERNDLGRLCIGGTVEVDEFMVIESYS
ncbi:MAG: chorismate-binding protein, partial [Gammaproteobacteria bacterium]